MHIISRTFRFMLENAIYNCRNRYVNEPARRFFTEKRGQQKLDCEQNTYDEVYAGGSATYYNTNVYEEVDGAADVSYFLN